MRCLRRGLLLMRFCLWMLVIGCPVIAWAQERADVAPARILGIFGGMGPEATANLYSEIVRQTKAAKDQDHIPTLIFSFPQVPDRTAAIQSGDRSIVPYLVEGVSRLEKAGASFIVIPCNTAHYYYDDMQRAVRIPIIHMIRETADTVRVRHPDCKVVGLLATSGTIRSGLYGKELRARGLSVVLPDPDVEADCVMRAVYQIKAGGDKRRSADLLAKAAENVQAKGAQVIVLGCTEIPLAFDVGRAAVPVVNATQVLAEAAIRAYSQPSPPASVAPTAAGRPRPRARDLGIVVGVLPPGKLNAITDVAGVRVGHTTLVRGDRIRTGVTAVLPHAGNVFQEKVPGAIFVGNGFGKLMGYTQVEELGEIETPILLTSTLSVPRVADALLDYVLAQPGNENVRSVNPLVAETNDGYLNDIRGRHVGRAETLAAIRTAHGGPVEEGSVGAGTGSVAFGFKGGIGTASRVVPQDLGGYTVGVLVQANFGGVLTINGAPVGRELGKYYLSERLESSLGVSHGAQPGDSARGSIIMVVATDAPLDARNLKRLAARAMLGLARTGSASHNGSGDYAIAFSTAPENRIRQNGPVRQVRVLGNEAVSPLFLAAVEATEEAIYNALLRATTVTGRDGHRIEALPIDRTVEILNRHRALKGRPSLSR